MSDARFYLRFESKYSFDCVVISTLPTRAVCGMQHSRCMERNKFVTKSAANFLSVQKACCLTLSPVIALICNVLVTESATGTYLWQRLS